MKIPRIYQALTASLFFHLSFIAVAVFVISRVTDYRQPLPYVVSLVDDRASSASRQSAPRESPSQKAPETPKTVKQSVQPAVPPASTKSKAHQTEQEKLMKERIEALQAKKRIEKLVALRKVIEVDASKTPAAKSASQSPEKASSQGAVSGSSSGRDYYAVVVDRIRQQWVFPGTLDRDIEAVVAIRIARDGRVTVDRVEKSSGNPLFDRSVVRAITLASPLPPPPQDMDIGVRFRP
jgi:colicin import membrane protein